MTVDDVREFAFGVNNVDAGIETTKDTLFQVASITKLTTATHDQERPAADRLLVCLILLHWTTTPQGRPSCRPLNRYKQDTNRLISAARWLYDVIHVRQVGQMSSASSW